MANQLYSVAMYFEDGDQDALVTGAEISRSSEAAVAQAMSRYYVDGGKRLRIKSIACMAVSVETLRAVLAALENQPAEPEKVVSLVTNVGMTGAEPAPPSVNRGLGAEVCPHDWENGHCIWCGVIRARIFRQDINVPPTDAEVKAALEFSRVHMPDESA